MALSKRELDSWDSVEAMASYRTHCSEPSASPHIKQRAGVKVFKALSDSAPSRSHQVRGPDSASQAPELVLGVTTPLVSGEAIFHLSFVLAPWIPECHKKYDPGRMCVRRKPCYD